MTRVPTSRACKRPSPRCRCSPPRRPYPDTHATPSPEGHAAHILVGAGEYHETVNVTRSAPLTLLGQLPLRAALGLAQPAPAPLARIWAAKYIGQRPGMDDADTATLVVAPNYAAALIGAPLQPSFGNADFRAYNLGFENRAADYAIAQALASDVSYANASFYGCAFASFQDTWYTGRNASTYVVDSTVYGQTDYVFGFGTAWFERTTLANRACGGGIVAWKGTNQSDAPGNRYGAYISDSRIIRSPDANATGNTTEQCFLGRPWNDLATTVFLRTYMEDVVRPAGFEPFSTARPTIMNTTYYAEFDSHGAPSPPLAPPRVPDVLCARPRREHVLAGAHRAHPDGRASGGLYGGEGVSRAAQMDRLRLPVLVLVRYEAVSSSDCLVWKTCTLTRIKIAAELSVPMSSVPPQITPNRGRLFLVGATESTCSPLTIATSFIPVWTDTPPPWSSPLSMISQKSVVL
jgi:pectin methylesterase-like acyl-CoA thioesterase